MQWTNLVAVALAVLFTAGTARADRCASVVLKLVAKKEASLLTCQSKVAATNDPSRLETCRAKADEKFSASWARAGCITHAAPCGDAAADCESSIAVLLADTLPSACEARKRRAAGKLAKAELYCYAKAAAKAVAVDAGCIARARDKFDKALAAAGPCPDGGAPRDAVEQSCVQSVTATDCQGAATEACLVWLPLPPGYDEIPLCCDARGVCFGGTARPGTQDAGLFLSHCGRGGGVTRIGTTCELLACPPELPPGIQCGTCEDIPFQTTMCCQQGCSCFEETVSTLPELLALPCNLPPSGTDRLIEGTCGANGACVPGS